VQLAADSALHPNRILLPHSRNNSDVWVTHSDDDGLTWANATLVPPANSTDPSWQRFAMPEHDSDEQYACVCRLL
jgi:hypothetical protein